MADQAAIEADMPDEIRDEVRADYEQQQKQLADLSTLIARKREEAVSGRKQSGIEDIWQEDGEAYEGVDDANRATARILKPSSNEGGLRRQPTGSPTRSHVFLPITTQYVDNAAARVGDMLLPTDDRAFEIKPEPIPELTGLKGDTTPMLHPSGEPMLQPADEGEQGAIAGPQGNVKPVTKGDLAQKEMDEAEASAKKAEKRIDDWLIECQFHAEKRKAIHDRAKLGIGVMKGPFPVKRKAKLATRKGNTATLVIKEDIKPASRRIDPWNLYPDPACGEDIHAGNFILEKDFLTEKQLKALIGVPGYLDAQIEECLKEGPQKAYVAGMRPQMEKAEPTQYQIWYYYGDIKRTDLTACGCKVEGEDDESRPALMTMVNDRIIKAALNTLDSGEFPYDATPWQTREGHWAGIGVARQVREAQGGINAAVRNMLDNAALSGGPILAIDRTLLQPAKGDDWTLRARKIFTTRDEAESGMDISKAIHAFNIPSMQADLMAIIEFFLKMAEQTTGMPMLMQGQTGNAPDTLGGQLLATNNASTVLRRIARLDDDYSTEPHIRRYYEYLMLHGEDDDEKGNYTIDALGSSSLVERDIQNHALVQMAPFVKDPAYGIDPKKWFNEVAKSQKINPKLIQYTKDEQAKMAQTPPPPPIPIAVAQIRAASDEKVEAMKITHDVGVQTANNAAPGQGGAPDTSVQVAQIKQQTERERIESDRAEAAAIRAHEADMMRMKVQVAQLEFGNERTLQTDRVKADLAGKVMTLTTQERLSDKSTATDLFKHHNPVPQVAEPLAEPPGRAEPGEAFTQ